MNKKKLTLIIALIAVIIAGAYCTYNYFSKLRFEEKTIERTDENCEDDCFSVSLNYLHCKGNSEFAQNFNKEIEMMSHNPKTGPRSRPVAITLCSNDLNKLSVQG